MVMWPLCGMYGRQPGRFALLYRLVRQSAIGRAAKLSPVTGQGGCAPRQEPASRRGPRGGRTVPPGGCAAAQCLFGISFRGHLAQNRRVPSLSLAGISLLFHLRARCRAARGCAPKQHCNVRACPASAWVTTDYMAAWAGAADLPRGPRQNRRQTWLYCREFCRCTITKKRLCRHMANFTQWLLYLPLNFAQSAPRSEIPNEFLQLFLLEMPFFILCVILISLRHMAASAFGGEGFGLSPESWCFMALCGPAVQRGAPVAAPHRKAGFCSEKDIERLGRHPGFAGSGAVGKWMRRRARRRE